MYVHVCVCWYVVWCMRFCYICIIMYVCRLHVYVCVYVDMLFLYVVLKYQTCWRWCKHCSSNWVYPEMYCTARRKQGVHPPRWAWFDYMCVDTMAFWRTQMGNLGFSSLQDISINTISPFQYNLDCPHLNMAKMEKNRLIWTDIIKLDSGRTSISRITCLDGKIAHFKVLFSHIVGLIYYQAFLYGYTSMSCAL